MNEVQITSLQIFFSMQSIRNPSFMKTVNKSKTNKHICYDEDLNDDWLELKNADKKSGV